MWLKHFFDYYYVGPPGDGMFGCRHLILITVTILLSIALYQYFKRNPKHAGRFMVFFCSLLFMGRLFKQIYRVIVGIENPPLQAFPWHLCTLMTFVMPIVVIFNIKKLKQWIYPLSMIGGIVTIILGSYFDYLYLKLGDFEGMWAHMLLIFVPMIEMAIGEFKLEIKNVWQTAAGLIICTLWGLFADLVLFPKYHTNSSQLMENNLGFDIPGIPYPLLVVMIAVVFIIVMHGIPTIYRRIKYKNDLTAKFHKMQTGNSTRI